PARPLRRLAEGHGIATSHGDGNDADEVFRLAGAAVARARAGDGPAFIELATYRSREHCGPNFDNDLGYRSPEEAAAWLARCPIATLRERLRAAAALTERDEAELVDAIDAEIAVAFEFARTSPFPPAHTAGDYVYA
ncbi:MAG TPA: thiamine pyrophosphate-dependent enzyme, partial [Magnetospirillum sp.]|nr:thiamine pyrophosphate-dependent enzyme [Magnetospirillum sp.]